MAKLFVTYSHTDKTTVSKIVKKIDSSRHEVIIDEKFLKIGDAISTEIREKIKSVDYVVVFLSPNSVKSMWVRQELYETLFLEFYNKEMKLLPCVIEECELPDALYKFKQYKRIYLDFTKNFDEAISNLIDRLDAEKKSVFKDENYFRLDIAAPGLEIYMTGELYNWEKIGLLRYTEILNSYLLFGFKKIPHTFFKHFAICEHEEAEEVRNIILNSGYHISGFGDIDPATNKRRLWFCVRDYPIKGKKENNQWL